MSDAKIRITVDKIEKDIINIEVDKDGTLYNKDIYIFTEEDIKHLNIEEGDIFTVRENILIRDLTEEIKRQKRINELFFRNVQRGRGG